MGEYTRNQRWPKAQLKAACEKRAAELGIVVKAKTKAELASFLSFYGEPGTPRKT